MNEQQKQRALQMLRRFDLAVPMARQADNAAVAMATLVQELIDATEPASHHLVQINPSKAQLTQIINGLDHFFSDESRREFLSVWICDWTAHKLSVRPTPEPVAYQVRNGLVDVAIYQQLIDAENYANDQQKRHDLSGSLAHFCVVPLYTSPPANNQSEQHLEMVKRDLFQARQALLNEGQQRDKLMAALTEIAELDILKYHHAYAIAKGAIEEIEALKCSNS